MNAAKTLNPVEVQWEMERKFGSVFPVQTAVKGDPDRSFREISARRVRFSVDDDVAILVFA